MTNNKLRILDDVLDDDNFARLENVLLQGAENFQWSITNHVTGRPDENNSDLWNWQGVHHFYKNDVPCSEQWEMIRCSLLIPMMKNLKGRTLIRAKANLYPWTNELQVHDWHCDYDFPHYGAIFCMNTCDGYTKFEDGTKVESVANRLVLFDASKPHCSTNTTNQPRRVNINFNYF